MAKTASLRANLSPQPAVPQSARRRAGADHPRTDFTVIPNGIDLAAFTPSDSNRQPTLLIFIGKMDYRPNIDAVLWFGRHVFPQIRQQQPDVRFQIIGLNPHARLDELRSMPGIEITGGVEDVRPFIAAATLYVIPLRVGGGTRFKALEAMACGKPPSALAGRGRDRRRRWSTLLIADTRRILPTQSFAC